MPKTKSFASSLDEPAELVEKNSQILIEYSLKNKESKKKKWCTISSSDERETTKTSQSALDSEPFASSPDEPAELI